MRPVVASVRFRLSGSSISIRSHDWWLARVQAVRTGARRSAELTSLGLLAGRRATGGSQVDSGGGLTITPGSPTIFGMLEPSSIAAHAIQHEMTVKMFANSVRNAFISSGFRSVGAGLLFRGNVATVVIKVTKIPHADRHVIDVGFCLPEVTRDIPLSPEKTQMYFRLDRVFPGQKAAILDGGDVQSPRQAEALATLVAEIARELAPSLIELSSSYAALHGKFIKDGSALGLVTKEARALLEKKVLTMEVMRVVRGEAPWSDLHSFGVVRDGREWRFPSFASPVRVSLEDLDVGFRSYSTRPGERREWAQFILAASSLVEFDSDREPDRGAVMLSALWDVAFGENA